MTDFHIKIPKDKYLFLDPVSVTIDNFEANGAILDVGGGGEGIIGILKGNRVIAIDISKNELEEAPEGPIKTIMDAREMRFLRNSFDVVTAFFSLMYFDPYDHERTFKEINRVLKPDGKFYFWDITQPLKESDLKQAFAFKLNVVLPSRVIETAYGARLREQKIDVEHYKDVLTLTGFKILQYQSQPNGLIKIIAAK